MDAPIPDLLGRIDAPNMEPARRLFDDVNEYIPNAAGSTKSHHAWHGGYNDHIQEVMNLAQILYDRLSAERRLEFSLSSALLVLFLHDCEKPFRHASDKQLANFPWITDRPEKSDKKFQQLLIKQYGFEIKDDEANALLYVEGEPESEYQEGVRLQRPLAAFCHVCDTISARIWYDSPKARER